MASADRRRCRRAGPLRLDAPQCPHRVEGLASRLPEYLIGSCGVLRFEGVARACAARHAHARDARHRECRRVALQHAGQLGRQRDGAHGPRVFGIVPLRDDAIQPSVRCALHAGRAGLHVVLGVEMRPRGIGRSTRMDHCELAPRVQGVQRRQARMQAEVAIEVERAAGAAGSRDGNRRSCGVVLAIAVRHDHVEPVDRPALEHHDQHLAPPGRRGHRFGEEMGREAEAQQRHRALLHENASILHVGFASRAYCSRLKSQARRLKALSPEP